MEVVEGGARGADKIGREWAKLHNIPYKTFPADWDKHKRVAGFIRNSEMAEYATHCIALWDGVSRGTKHMIDTAEKKGLKLRIVYY